MSRLSFLVVLLNCYCLAQAGVVHPNLFENGGTVVEEAILELPPVVDALTHNVHLRSTADRVERAAIIANLLQSEAERSQAPYVAVLEKFGVYYKGYWGSNIIHMKNLPQSVANLLVSSFPNDDFTLRRPFTVSLPAIRHKQVVNATGTQQPQWGVAKIGAPAAWATTTGEGSVVGIIDTGVYLGHSALQAGYAGAWHDPYYSRPNPTDSQGHGTHCAGTVVGRSNGIGVAPGGRWIACRGLNNEGSGTEAQLIRCAEFMLTANPLPHVVSCSWGGGQGDVWYNQVVQAWREANIIPVFAIGNDGSWCRSVISPGDQRNLIGVGATTRLWDSITNFSSRGPTIIHDPQRIKPDMVAPGEDITSADAHQGGYVQMSGTSMAAPHVAGAILLLQAANNHSLTYDQVYDALSSTAFRGELINGDRNCGLPNPDSNFPNYAWGHGRISVGDAINTDFGVKK